MERNTELLNKIMEVLEGNTEQGHTILYPSTDPKEIREVLERVINPCSKGHDYSYEIFPVGRCRRCGVHD